MGTASGILAQMRVNGQALGIALSAAVVAARLPVHLGASGGSATAQAAALEAAIHDAFVVAALVFYQMHSHRSSRDDKDRDATAQVKAQREMFHQDHEQREVRQDEAESQRLPEGSR